jgi:hypothetical protein
MVAVWVEMKAVYLVERLVGKTAEMMVGNLEVTMVVYLVVSMVVL